MEPTTFERIRKHYLNIKSGLATSSTDSYSLNVDAWTIACKIVELELYAEAHLPTS